MVTRVPPGLPPVAGTIGVLPEIVGAFAKVTGVVLKPATCMTQLPLVKGAVPW